MKVLIELILATPIQFWIARPFYSSAYGALRYNHSANMDTLVVISTSTAYFYSVISTILAISQVDYAGIAPCLNRYSLIKRWKLL